MNKIKLYKKSVVLLGLISFSIAAQNQSKTFEERFNVGDEAILEINTSHTDIEFKTWNKNEILIEATIELADVSKEDAESYFENNSIKIIGNSKKIKVSAIRENIPFTSSPFNYRYQDPNGLNMPKKGELIELNEMPPLPKVHFRKFDYNAYKMEGEAYMKQWQKEFSKGFDKEYEKNIEKWGKRMEERAESLAERNKDHAERIANGVEERAHRQDYILEKRLEDLVERAANVKRIDSLINFNVHIDSIRMRGANTFYFNTTGDKKNLKIKKTIKIKMPKSVKLKMNVKHGEVILAENVNNLNARLSHSILLAATVDGDETEIIAMYTPVSVQNWNHGQLVAKYSDQVALNKVQNLDLQSTSSEVTIDNLLNTLFVENSFGPIHIKSISDDFSDIELNLKNSEAFLKLPKIASAVNIESVDSEIKTPDSINFSKTKNAEVITYSGIQLNKNNKKSINIKSVFSEVVFH
ncbi:hypothetical protein [Aurantibacter sp.]|uniref:hypothetical protein n=1 Tax=Aurantibacter sp. TaxID=2807103 RepID=UPI0032643840